MTYLYTEQDLALPPLLASGDSHNTVEQLHALKCFQVELIEVAGHMLQLYAMHSCPIV